LTILADYEYNNQFTSTTSAFVAIMFILSNMVKVFKVVEIYPVSRWNIDKNFRYLL